MSYHFRVKRGNLETEGSVMLDGESATTDQWAEGNREGRERAMRLLERMRETRDPTLLLAECRSLNDPFYGAEGVGFFHVLAAAILDD